MLEAVGLDNQQTTLEPAVFVNLQSTSVHTPQGGGNALHNSNVAGTAPHVRHYPFPAFQGNIAFGF